MSIRQLAVVKINGVNVSSRAHILAHLGDVDLLAAFHGSGGDLARLSEADEKIGEAPISPHCDVPVKYAAFAGQADAVGFILEKTGGQFTNSAYLGATLGGHGEVFELLRTKYPLRARDAGDMILLTHEVRTILAQKEEALREYEGRFPNANKADREGVLLRGSIAIARAILEG